jgi:hypothetical protein
LTVDLAGVYYSGHSGTATEYVEIRDNDGGGAGDGLTAPTEDTTDYDRFARTATTCYFNVF